MAFCKKCQPQIKEFLKKFDDWLLKNVDVAILAVQGIKRFIDNPVIDLITVAIPGKLDDQIKVKLRESFAFALDQLIDLGKCNKSDTVEAKLLCYSLWLAQLPKAVKDAHLFKFAALVTANLDEHRYQQFEYDTAAQMFYAANK